MNKKINENLRMFGFAYLAIFVLIIKKLIG